MLYVLILAHNIQYRIYDIMDQPDIDRCFLTSIVHVDPSFLTSPFATS